MAQDQNSNNRPSIRRLPKSLWIIPIFAVLMATPALLSFLADGGLGRLLGGLITHRRLLATELSYLVVAIVVATVWVLISVGYRYEWTGFGAATLPESSKGEVRAQKTLWDWFSLLIVPAVLLLGGFWFTTAQDQRARDSEEQRAQAEALQAYLDDMGELMLNKELLEAKEEDPVLTLARARTSAVMLRLDAEDNRTVTRFLTQSGLSGGRHSSISLLKGIDLAGAELNGAVLPQANFIAADLSGADLSRADLTGADLKGADLKGADLSDAYLSSAIGPSGPMLSEAIVSDPNLSGANRFPANLSKADLRNANLSGADLAGVNLKKAYLGETDLQGATMPNGQKYEDWRKDNEGSEKYVENE